MKRICVVGAGYVGLVTAACFAHIGHEVFCVDIDEEKIKQLRCGKIPFYEKGLKKKVVKGVNRGMLHFTTDLSKVFSSADEETRLIFICVGTPAKPDGTVDLTAYYSAINSVCINIARARGPDTIIVNKSTMPVGATKVARFYVATTYGPEACGRVSFVSNPEFLREGTAVKDFLHPDRIIIGTFRSEIEAHMLAFYSSFCSSTILCMTSEEAEMVKYMSNAFLATKISFANEMADICNSLHVDIERVREGVVADSRINDSFLHSGLGWGGSCLPKDVKALRRATVNPTPLLDAVADINDRRALSATVCIRNALREQDKHFFGKKICVLGRSFKPNTDDTRESPAIRLIKSLVIHGALVNSYDPKAPPLIFDGVENCESLEEALIDADVMVLATEWDEFRHIDFDMVKRLMRGNLVYDGRCAYKKYVVQSLGLKYIANGRG